MVWWSTGALGDQRLMEAMHKLDRILNRQDRFGILSLRRSPSSWMISGPPAATCRSETLYSTAIDLSVMSRSSHVIVLDRVVFDSMNSPSTTPIFVLSRGTLNDAGH